MDTVNVTVICIASVIISIVVAIASNHWHGSVLKVEAIKSGATPRQLSCTYNPPHENTARLLLCGDFDLKPKEPN